MIFNFFSSIKNFFSSILSFFTISKKQFGIITFGTRNSGKTTILRTLYEDPEFSIERQMPGRHVSTIYERPWRALLPGGKVVQIQDMPGAALDTQEQVGENEIEAARRTERREENEQAINNLCEIDLLLFTLDPEILYSEELDTTIVQMIRCLDIIKKRNPNLLIFVCYTKFDEYDIGFNFSDKVFNVASDKYTSYKTGRIFSSPEEYNLSSNTGIKKLDSASNNKDSDGVKKRKKDILNRSRKLWIHLKDQAQRGLVNGYFVAAEPAENGCYPTNHQQLFRDFMSLKVSNRPNNKLRFNRLIAACLMAVLAIAPLSYFLKLHANDVSRYLQRKIPNVPHSRMASLLGVDFSAMQTQKNLTGSLLHTALAQCEKTECSSKEVIQKFKKKVKQENSNFVFSVTEQTKLQLNKIIEIYNLSKKPIQNRKKINHLYTVYQKNPDWFPYTKEHNDSEKKNILELVEEMLCQQLTKQKLHQQAGAKRDGSTKQNNPINPLLVEILRGETYPFLFTKVLVSPKCNQLESLLQQAQELVLPLRLPAPEGTEISTQFSCAWEDSSKNTSVEIETSQSSGEKCSLIKLSKQKISIGADFSLKRCQHIENIWIKKGNTQTIAVVASDKEGRRIERFSALLFALSAGNELRFYQKNETCVVLSQASSKRLLTYLRQVYEFFSHQRILQMCEKHEYDSAKKRCSRTLSSEEYIQIRRYCKQRFEHIQNKARNCQTLLKICREPRGGM